MTFEEKLDRVIILLQCLLEDKAKTTGFTHVGTTLDVPMDIKGVVTKDIHQEMRTKAQYTQNDIRQMVTGLKNKGHNASDLKELLNKQGYTAISDIADVDIDRVYNAFSSL